MPKTLKIAVSLLAISLLLFSCRGGMGGSGGCDPGPTVMPLNFAVLDKNGNSLVKTLKDSVTVTFLDNGNSNLNKTITLTVRKNYTNYPADTINVSPKYNGLYITDIGQMSILSSQSPPVNTFNLSVNGKSAGVIFISSAAYQMTYPNLTVAAFTFNNNTVIYDHSTSTGLELLQLQ